MLKNYNYWKVHAYWVTLTTVHITTKQEETEQKTPQDISRKKSCLDVLLFCPDILVSTVYYQFGCGIPKMVGPKKQDFWPKGKTKEKLLSINDS